MKRTLLQRGLESHREKTIDVRQKLWPPPLHHVMLWYSDPQPQKIVFKYGILFFIYAFTHVDTSFITGPRLSSLGRTLPTAKEIRSRKRSGLPYIYQHSQRPTIYTRANSLNWTMKPFYQTLLLLVVPQKGCLFCNTSSSTYKLW